MLWVCRKCTQKCAPKADRWGQLTKSTAESAGPVSSQQGVDWSNLASGTYWSVSDRDC